MELLRSLGLVSIFLVSCTTTSHETTDIAALDIKPIVKAPIPMTVAEMRVKPEAVFNWQSYFKSPPSAKDRTKLAKTVDDLKSASSVSEFLKRARNEVALGRYAAAEATYREALRKERNHLDALTELAALYHRVKNNDACLNILSDIKDTIAAQEKPNKMAIFRYRYVLALASIQRGDRERGHEILSDLIGQEKSFVPGYAALASSYLALGKDQVAKFIVERGLDRGRDDPSLYNLLGVISEKQGRNAQARDYYNKAVSLSDSFAPALVNRANLYIASREYTLAEGDLKKSLEIDPLNTDAMISLGIVLKKTGRTDQAKLMVRRVLDIAPDSAEARYNLALIMRDHTKDSTEALRLFNEVTQTERASNELKTLARAAADDLKNL